MKIKFLVLPFLLLVCLKSDISFAVNTPTTSHANQDIKGPHDYLIGKLLNNDIVLLGERHNQDHQLEMVKSLIARLSKELPATMLALVVPNSEQDIINHFFETGDGLERIIFSTHLSNPLYKDLIIAARESGIRILAIDMPPRFKNAQLTRDEYMANSLIAEMERKNNSCKIIALVGCRHAIKARIEWVVVGHPDKFLGMLLKKKSPSLRIFSICQIIGTTDNGNVDATDKLRRECMAYDAVEAFPLYQSDNLPQLNSKPINIHRSFDGVIYHPNQPDQK